MVFQYVKCTHLIIIFITKNIIFIIMYNNFGNCLKQFSLPNFFVFNILLYSFKWIYLYFEFIYTVGTFNLLYFFKCIQLNSYKVILSSTFILIILFNNLCYE